jgi:hypothetical protein
MHDTCVERSERSLQDAPRQLAPYRREKLLAACWHAVLVAVGLIEVLSSWLRIGSFATGPFLSIWLGVGLFAGGAIFNAVVIWLTKSGTQPWKFTEVPAAPLGTSFESVMRTALRVVINTWPSLIGVTAGLAFPPLGGFGGGGALPAALECAWDLQRVSRVEQLRGWRLFWSAPERLRLVQKRVPESGYYRDNDATGRPPSPV